MKKGDASYVKCTILEEGFDYSFDGYSNFNRIEDEKFHLLRNAYLNAKDELENYLTDQKENGEEGGLQ